MQTATKVKTIAILLVIFTFYGISDVFSRIEPGAQAPHFVLEDVYGRSHKLAAIKDNTLTIIYFFDTESRASQEGLLSLNTLVKQFPSADLVIWGITRSPKNRVSDFIVQHKAEFPIMIDSSDVSTVYDAELVLPTIYILGPGLTVIDTFQGGGETTDKMLLALAEKELQREELPIALALTKDIQKKDPGNVNAKTIYGYAALKADKKEEAKDVFMELAKQPGEAGTAGKEGLAQYHFDKGETSEALALVNDVEKEAPNRGYVNVLKADHLYAQKKEKEAAAEYKKAVAKSDGTSFQKAYAHNQYGRLLANLGSYDQARIHYDQAIEFDSYNLVAMSNKGVAYQKEGRLEEALAAFQEAIKINKNDAYAEILARKAQELISLQKNIAEKKRIDRLVKELAERFRKQSKASSSDKEDSWTSRPMVITFIDFQEKGALSTRDGMSTVLTTQLTDQLNQSGRVQVVERVVMDRLLEELNLGSSELAAPQTALKLGQILAAKLVTTGTLLHTPDSSLLSMRMIDSETTAVPKVVTRKITPNGLDIDKDMQAINRTILNAVIAKYPLQGFIVQASGKEAIINLGANQGVVQGTVFEVIEEGRTIKYKGKEMKGLPVIIGKVQVARVEPDMCSVQIIEQTRPLKKDDKIKETPIGVAANGSAG